MSTSILYKTADVLSKVASIFEQEELADQEKKASLLKSEYIDPIKAAFPKANSSLTEKLANTDPEILELIKGAASVSTSYEDDGDFGDPTEKLAADAYESDPLLAFCMSED